MVSRQWIFGSWRRGTSLTTECVPRVNSDGNENVGSVPSVVFQAPLGTYVGWNIPSGFYEGQQVQLSGGYWPFQETTVPSRHK